MNKKTEIKLEIIGQGYVGLTLILELSKEK